MEESGRVRCDSLDTGLGCEKELVSPGDYKNLHPEELPAAELAQCEAEVRMLLSIITEVNKKMGSLKAPSDLNDLRPSSPLFPDLLSHGLVRDNPEKKSEISSKHSPAFRGGVIWTTLLDTISAVEDSIQCRRSWAAPLTVSDQDKHREHMRAAQDSWTKASQILEDMERELGISCPSLPKMQKEERLHQETRNRSPSQNLQGETEDGEVEDRNKLASHHRAWRSGSVSPSYRHCTTIPFSPDWTSQSVPGSPLVLMRSAMASPPSTVGGDCFSMGSLYSGSPDSINPEMQEVQRLTRYMEKLKSRNERLTADVERKRAESDQLVMTAKRLELDCSALHAALRHCEQSEEVYDELLALYDVRKQHEGPHLAEVCECPQSDNPWVHVRQMGTEEISTSFSTAGGAKEISGPGGQRNPQTAEREVFLLRQIAHLKKERATFRLPKRNQAAVENQMVSDCGSEAPSFPHELSRPALGKREKLVCELASAREEMSNLQALVHLKEKELRCLELSLLAQKVTRAPGVLDPENPGKEQASCKMEQQRLYECQHIPALQAVLHKEQVLKRRMALVHDSDSASNSCYSEDQIARLTHVHSKALSSYRHIRRKYREHVWRLEQKVAAMVEGQRTQSESSKSEEVEWRREETVL